MVAVVSLSWGFCVCAHLCLLRCSGFQLHLCLLDLGIGVWSVFVLILSKITVCLLWAHLVLSLIAVVCLSELGKGTIRGRSHNLSSMALRLLAGESAGMPIKICGILQESPIFFERALASSGLDLNFGFAVTRMKLCCRCREHLGHTPTALFSGPAPALVPAKTATGNFHLHHFLG